LDTNYSWSKSLIFPSFISDPTFLDFFFRRVKINDTQRYQSHFPYISPCGPELNFLRCDDTPYVYHSMLTTAELTAKQASAYKRQRSIVKATSSDTTTTTIITHHLVYAGTLSTVFDPFKLRMTTSGRLYYESPKQAQSLALVANFIGMVQF